MYKQETQMEYLKFHIDKPTRRNETEIQEGQVNSEVTCLICM
jgi:hypothetical protein